MLTAFLSLHSQMMCQDCWEIQVISISLMFCIHRCLMDYSSPSLDHHLLLHCMLEAMALPKHYRRDTTTWSSWDSYCKSWRRYCCLEVSSFPYKKTAWKWWKGRRIEQRVQETNRRSGWTDKCVHYCKYEDGQGCWIQWRTRQEIQKDTSNQTWMTTETSLLRKVFLQLLWDRRPKNSGCQRKMLLKMHRQSLKSKKWFLEEDLSAWPSSPCEVFFAMPSLIFETKQLLRTMRMFRESSKEYG